MSDETSNSSSKGQTPDGTKKPDLPPGLAGGGDDQDQSASD